MLGHREDLIKLNRYDKITCKIRLFIFPYTPNGKLFTHRFNSEFQNNEYTIKLLIAIQLELKL